MCQASMLPAGRLCLVRLDRLSSLMSRTPQESTIQRATRLPRPPRPPSTATASLTPAGCGLATVTFPMCFACNGCLRAQTSQQSFAAMRAGSSDIEMACAGFGATVSTQ